MNKENKEYLLDLNILSSILFIVTILVSIFLTVNEKNKLNNKTCLDNTSSKNISIINKCFAIFIIFLFLYTSLVDYQDKKERGNETIYSKLQITSNVLILVSSFISLYVIVNNNSNEIINYSNPDV